MADITMCRGTDCPHKELCYRYTAPVSDSQSYFLNVPIKDGKCDFYWGENSQSIWNQLNSIVGKTDSSSNVPPY